MLLLRIIPSWAAAGVNGHNYNYSIFVTFGPLLIAGLMAKWQFPAARMDWKEDEQALI